MHGGLLSVLSTRGTPSTCRGARLRASFRPKGQIVALRSYVRQRERLLQYAASHIQHMQKALTEMNFQLHHVVADITGATGLRIIRAILAGERDPQALAALRHYSCHSSAETIARGLTGSYRAEHLFALEQALALYDAYREKVSAGDVRIEAVLKELSIHRGRDHGQFHRRGGGRSSPRARFPSTGKCRKSPFPTRMCTRSLPTSMLSLPRNEIGASFECGLSLRCNGAYIRNLGHPAMSAFPCSGAAGERDHSLIMSAIGGSPQKTVLAARFSVRPASTPIRDRRASPEAPAAATSI